MSYAIDPELAPTLELIPPTDLSDLPATRRRYERGAAALDPPDETGVEWNDRTIPAREGTADVAVRVYRPAEESGPLPGLCYLHAGGFVLGSVATEHARCLALCREVGAVVVSVDYRLAPERPYPAALDDAHAAFLWMVEHARELDLDGERVALRGLSAGGGLAAAVALRTRDRGEPRARFQLLASPQLDDRLQTASMTAFVDTPLWNRPSAVVSWESYLGTGVSGSRDVPADAAPARATDLTGLPPTYVAVMEFDPLRDEGIAYARALQAAGIPVELHQFPGTFHGSAQVCPQATVSRRERAEEVAVLRGALHP